MKLTPQDFDHIAKTRQFDKLADIINEDAMFLIEAVMRRHTTAILKELAYSISRHHRERDKRGEHE